MITIDLEENNEDVVPVPDKPQETKETPNDFKFKRKLVFQVRNHRSLYDNKHKHFQNVAKKEIVWQQIASKLDSNVEDCKETWFELRYQYQQHVRKLRYYFTKGHKENKKRPVMSLESEMMFLWRFIDDRKTCDLPFDIANDDNTPKQTEQEVSQPPVTLKPIDDDLILVEQPVELIVIDEDDDAARTEKAFKINSTMRNLIPQIKNHPELYDTSHKDFKNYTRKSFLWNAIASTMGDKATKLMKCWIVMTTRYEWEISQKKVVESELQKELNFFKDYILKNPDTVYKQSYYLKRAWYDPIDYFKDIYNLIVRMKKMSDIVAITDLFLNKEEKSNEYLSSWRDIAILKNNSAGQCETTWLIMRFFYWELMHMRQENYQLTDKWYFETIISELYAISKQSQTSKMQELQSFRTKTKKPSKRPAQISATLQGAPTNKQATPLPTVTSSPVPMSSTIINNLSMIPATITTCTTTSPCTVQPTLTLPKITAAISLAPQALSSGSLQIKQISGPPSLSPAPFQLNGTNTTVTPTSVAVSKQMTTMSFSLPTQTKVTQIPMPTTMPALIRPVIPNNTQSSSVRNTAPPLISVRPAQALLRPQIHIAPWATAPKTNSLSSPIHNNQPPLIPTPPTTMNSFASPSPHMQANLQPVPPNTAPPNMINTIIPAHVQVSPQTSQYENLNGKTIPSLVSTNTSVTTYKITTLPSNTTSTSLITPLTNHSNNSNTKTLIPPTLASITNTNKTSISSNTNTNNTSQMPKITGAISLLNPNEILIELISSPIGNQLVVHGPPLSAKYQLPMVMVTKFIREVMAIPILHSKRSPANLHYWEHISNIFNFPVHISRAIWNFLLENFSHFPQIAPMSEIMQPFKSALNVWTESKELFAKFDEMSYSKGWIKHVKTFPDVVQCISAYPVLYQDVAPDKSNEKVSVMEALCVWRTIGLRFPKISEIQEIWNALKLCFIQYMYDLEVGIDHKWPLNWWRSLARMKFLVGVKYTENEPYFYIVNNKISEEIDLCATKEIQNRKKSEENSTHEKNIEMEIMASVISSKEKLKEVELNTLVAAILKHPIIFSEAGVMEKHQAWKKVAEELCMEVPNCLIAFRNAIENFLAYKKRDPCYRASINARYYKKMEEIIQSVPLSKLSSPTFAKVNLKSPESDKTSENELVFPERFISEINMTNNESNLVVKNWIYALGNLPNGNSEIINIKLKEILKKYLARVI